ncbi:unnamed protein product [Lactuca saligna]|uniref:Uncharacterized protein n=1 Tax=Lactuca saligna TaxID=75948 RepID=A0AA35YPE7_LACSI|nr:unnamed protein product [Lactuca saligna]
MLKSCFGSSKKPKREAKVVKKEKKVVVIKEFPSLKNICSPRSLLGVIQGLSREQKECIRVMGFVSLLRMKMIDVPLKIAYYVLDHINFETLKVEFENCQVGVDSKSIHEILGLPSGGSLLSNMDYIAENSEESCMFELKKHYENIDKLRLKHLKNEFVRTSAADDNFRINFLVLFINIFYESTSMGKCNLNPLYLIRRNIDLSSIDWCDFIVDCLVRMKQVYNPEKESSFFYRSPTPYGTFLEDILQENGGFGYEDANEPSVEEECQEYEYNEEEYGGNEDEFDGDEDEEEFDVNKVSVMESVVLIDSQKGVSFSQFMCDPVVESFLKPSDQGTEKLVDCCINQKQLEDDVNDNLIGFEKNEFDIEVLVEISKAKKDGERVVQGEGVEFDLNLGEEIKDCSNKNKDGETAKEDLQIIQWKDSNET